MTDLALRPAVVGDAADIHALLLKTAADIPLAVETLEQEEALYGQVRKLLAFGESWVALAGGGIAGFVLVENVETGRHWGENEMLELRFAGAETALAARVFDALIARLLERTAPIEVSVKDTNRNGLAARLEGAGFRVTETRRGERHFRREAGGKG
jgi:hypothetical protein